MTETRRGSDWPERLFAEIGRASKRQFEFGKHDCCLFAANCIKAMTGKDPARGFRRYRSELGAYKLIRRQWAGKLENIATGPAGGTEIPVSMAQRGDLVLAVLKDTDALGICVGSEAAFASDGVAYLPMSECVKAWSIARG